MQREILHTTAAMITAVLWGCTPNFWSLRTGIEGGEVEGSVEASMLWSDGCNDATIFAINEQETALLMFEMTDLLRQMNDDNKRLETLVLGGEDDFSLTLQTGRNLYSLPCYNEYYGYYDSYEYYYDSYGETEEAAGKDYEDEPEREFRYASGDIRLNLTAKSRHWDYYDDPVHAKLLLDGVTLVEPGTGATVSISGMLVQTYIYQWYWY
jgi:hypothetical protein